MAIEFIVSKFPLLTELIVNYTGEPHEYIMDSRLHNFFKSVCMRGVNVAAKEEGESLYHFYLATDLSLLTKALHIRLGYRSDHGPRERSYVYITQGPRLQHNLPLLVQMVMAKVSHCDRSVILAEFTWQPTMSRCRQIWTRRR